MIVLPQENDTWEVKMKPVEFIIKEGDEHLTSHSGLALIGALLDRTELGIASMCRDAARMPGAQDSPRRYCEIDDRIVVYGKA